MNLRQGKYGQPVKDQWEDVYGAHLRSALRTHLHFYSGLYLQPISLKLEAGPEPLPEYVDGSVSPAEGFWQGNATLPGTQPQTFALIKIDLGTCYFFVPLNHLLHCLYVRSAGHKDSDIIGVRRDLHSDIANKKDSAQGQISHPKAFGAGAPRQRHREEATGGNSAGPTARARTPPNAPCSLAPPPAGCGTTCWSICGNPVWIQWFPKPSPKTDGPPYRRPWTDPNWWAQL